MLSEYCKEAEWLLLLAASIPRPCNSFYTIILQNNSQSAIVLSRNESINRRDKPNDSSYRSVRDIVSNGTIKLEYVPLTEMGTDMVMKALEEVKLDKLQAFAENGDLMKSMKA